jgi:hypothetical protein
MEPARCNGAVNGLQRFVAPVVVLGVSLAVFFASLARL